MKVIAFIEGRPVPQPRTTQRVRFLFGRSLDYWEKEDAKNAERAQLGMLNKKGKPYKATRYAYRLRRLQKINEYRARVLLAVQRNVTGDIPYKYLFFVFLLHPPKSWTKKKRAEMKWALHDKKPDYSNLIKGVEDALYEQDNKCNAVGIYKFYAPAEYPEGLLIIENREIHQYVIDTSVEILEKMFDKKSATD